MKPLITLTIGGIFAGTALAGPGDASLGLRSTCAEKETE